ncbi:hypothetical protein KRX19_07935 [Cardiobacteriaceae bacterium TAE3-ERU3]|nr:hypothetical protein [Cardiobacteriaceae bacterium TAE3-ERU3]
MSIELTDHLTTAIIVTDVQARIDSLNPAAEDLVQRSGNACYQHPLDELIYHPDGWRTLLELAAYEQRSIVARNIAIDVSNTRQRHHADIAVKQINTNQYLIELHTFTRAHSIMHSQALQHQAEHNRLLIRNLAHEIRNPLAGIKGAAQRVRDLVDERATRYLDIIITQSERLNQLLKTMTGEGKPELRPDNIHRTIEQAIAVFTSAPENTNITIRRTYDPSIPDIPLDDNQIQQVILNLLSNATKASDYHGDITIQSEIVHQYTIGNIRHRQVVAIRISDHGCGIPEALHTAIFQPMISHFHQGSGLGLAIVQNIIHQHHGAVELDSEPGHTTLSIILPTTS